jgi:DNA invertase Pin-like site-specific DNA recombinase
MRRFAWYGRLSTKDKQDRTLSFPSQRDACARKVEELGGRIVTDFTDQESGRRDDRQAWSDLVREARNDGNRFDAVVIYSTSRLARDLFRALAYERELARAGVEVFYAVAAGDQTSPEGRLVRHIFQALDQFEVEKLGRETRRGQTENARQGYRNGGRAPYGYRLEREPHPDPRRARAGDRKSRLAPDPDQAQVVAEIFDRYLAGWGFKEIANHLNRPGGPPPPQHVDSSRNTAGKWSKTTIRAILENPVYTGRLYWNRLDFRQAKLGEGPVVRRAEEEWVESQKRHEAIVPDDWFERAAAELNKRSRSEGARRRSPQRRFYQLRGIVHCATGHNPLRMHGKERKGITYYACSYRISYGDKAAEAQGHGKWQYVREEDALLAVIDGFFEQHVFGQQRIARFLEQRATLEGELRSEGRDERTRLERRLTDVDQRVELQLRAIEAGVDPTLVRDRVETLKAERDELQAALGELDDARRTDTAIDLDDACEILDSLPNLTEALAAADPELRRRVFDAFRLAVALDRNAGQIRVKALISSAFTKTCDLQNLVANGSIAGAGFEPATSGL